MQQDIDGLMCEHPLSDISIAGEAVHPLPTSFHTLLQTVADMMMLLPHGSALQQMAMRCWCLRFRPADHVFLHHSHVFSNINQILSRSDSQEGEGEDSVASSSDSLPASLVCCYYYYYVAIVITSAVKSSRLQLCAKFHKAALYFT